MNRVSGICGKMPKDLTRMSLESQKEKRDCGRKKILRNND